ncbi:MAG: hypothetical protein ABJF23_24790 [Bryobacteraceae bacterium]
MQGDGVATLDALMRALRIDLSTVVMEAQRQNVSIFWLTYSTFLVPFTNGQKTAGERKKAEDRGKDLEKDAELLPWESGPGGWLSVFTELAHKSKVDAAAFLSRTTGARSIFFLKQPGLEDAIAAVGEEVHRQYVVSLQPPPPQTAEFHSIRVETRGRP